MPDKEREALEKLSRGQKTEKRLVFRSYFTLACSSGKTIREIASELHTRPNKVIQWRERYLRHGLKGLYDEQRTGKLKKYPEDLKIRIVKLIETDPPPGHSTWNDPLIAEKLNLSEDTIWNILRDEGIHLQRHRSWCIFTDPEFTWKSVDEKPGMQGIERPTGYVKASSTKIVKALKSTYRRNGTLNLSAALNVMTGVVNPKTTKTKKRVDFLAFIDEVLRQMS